MQRLWLSFFALMVINVKLTSGIIDPGSLAIGAVIAISAVFTGSYLSSSDHTSRKKINHGASDENIGGSASVEKCDDISLNFYGLDHDLNTKVHGQHLVSDTVMKTVAKHLDSRNPRKPLVLSFHGWTGGGKNFVSNFIIENIYKEKEKSPYVHKFNSYIHFNNPKKIGVYKEQLHKWIYHNVSKCERSMFIFDEMDQMPEGVVDVLIPFLGKEASVEGVDYRKSIFIFLRNLIDHFIPFLPLEREHVRLCILDEFKLQGVMNAAENDIEEVLDELEWSPEDLKLYSTSGCKTIAQKVAINY